MKLYGLASAGRNALVGNLRWMTTVSGSGAVTSLTITKFVERGLSTPSGGNMIMFRLAATSSAVSLSPLWNLTLSLILKVQLVPLSVGCGISVQRSQAK